jgi:mannose-1-phosphate guanylyltransferase/mannose-6-phosphate isomerase
VADLARSQEIRQLVEDLSTMGRTEHLSHTMVYRPWGHYQELDGGNGFRVKRITVKPGGALSMQRHHHRSEHWIVVRGEARVTRADSVVTLHPNESTYISAGTLHRLENVGALPLELIEVQTGSLLSEDDIERLSDDYGRAPTPTSRRPRGQS